MVGNFLDRQHFAEFVDIEGQTSGHPLARSNKVQIFDNDLPATSTDNLAVMAMEPDLDRPKIQIPDHAAVVNMGFWTGPTTTMTKGKESLVGNDIDSSGLGLPADCLMDNLDSTERKILCYTQSGHRRPPWVIFFVEKSFYPLELPDVHFLFHVKTDQISSTFWEMILISIRNLL
jgi:hypothetical protein